MAQLLPPIPKEPIEPNSHVWREWFNSIRNVIVGTAQGIISWASLNFDGSNITDIVTRNHNDLQTIQGGTANQYYHLTATQLTNLGTVTTVSVATSNGFAGTVATATTTPVITLKTSVTGLLKGNGTAISAATSGTDYAPATSGTSILYGNGSGGFSNVTIGTGVSFAAGTLSATGSGGTVTSVTGTAPVASSGGTTPVISMAAATTSVNGYLTSTDWTTFNNKGSGTVTSVAAITLGTTGTDLSSTVANGTTTPVITLQVPTASASNRGALSAADWTTFNSKGSGTVTSVTGSAPVVSSGGTTPAISMAAATTSVSGYLTSTDWTTFNNKGSGTVTSVSGTAGRISSTGGTTPVIDLVSGIASAGTTGSVSLIPVVTIDTYGRVTSITTAANPQGTVTSVGWTGGIVSVATATTTPAFTIAGTSGGVPYFSSASTWATSAALTASAIVIGGGAGAAPSTTTTGTGVVTALGVNTGSAGAFVVNGGALGTPSSGTVTNLTGTASININGTVGATTPATGAFTTLGASTITTTGATVDLAQGGVTPIITVGNASINAASYIRLNSTNTYKNWEIATNGYVVGLSFTPSTVVGGNTYTTPVLNILDTGITITGTLSATSTLSTSDTTDASSTTTGALKTAGGLAVVKKIYVGDNVVPAAAKGMNFSGNTPAAGMTSQLLNWYEEGTWTPNQGSGLTVVGTFSSSGTYTRIGRQVLVSVILQGSTSILVSTQGVLLTNLPFQTVGNVWLGTVMDNNGTVSTGCGTLVTAPTTQLYAIEARSATPKIFAQIAYAI